MDRNTLVHLLGFLTIFLYCDVMCADSIITQTSNNPDDALPTGAEKSSIIELMLKEPRATFFTGENMTGEAIIYDSTDANATWAGGCHNLWIFEEIRSMQIAESCVRVFKYNDCQGMSRSLYRKPNSGEFINFLTSKLPYVLSIGPCLPNEFQFASVFVNKSISSITKNESNIHHVPDMVDFFGGDIYHFESTSVISDVNPITHFYMDQGRPKWIGATIETVHLTNKTESTAGRNFVIPPGLGGSTNETYNIFEQSEKKFEEWKQITDQIQAYLTVNQYDWAGVTVTFVYEDSSTTKPYGFYYRVGIVMSNGRYERIRYGFIEN